MYHTRNGLDELDEKKAALGRKHHTRLSRQYG
jgi:hypothetical protein